MDSLNQNLTHMLTKNLSWVFSTVFQNHHSSDQQLWGFTACKTSLLFNSFDSLVKMLNWIHLNKHSPFKRSIQLETSLWTYALWISLKSRGLMENISNTAQAFQLCFLWTLCFCGIQKFGPYGYSQHNSQFMPPRHSHNWPPWTYP